MQTTWTSVINSAVAVIKRRRGLLPTASDHVLLLKLIIVNADHTATETARVNNESNLKTAIR